MPILTMRCKKTKNIAKENECDQGWQQGAQLAETHAACDCAADGTWHSDCAPLALRARGFPSTEY
jgi:hypothetical protein